MNKYLPNGTLGVALPGLLAAFMAGMAANISSFNTVFNYDIWQTYVRKGRRDSYYLRVGRVVTVIGILIGIATAFIASGYSNIINYIQLLFSYFNAPLFATFIIAMFWKRATPWAGVAGLRAARSVEAAATTAGQRRTSIAGTSALMRDAVEAGWLAVEVANAVGMKAPAVRSRVARVRGITHRSGLDVPAPVQQPDPMRAVLRTPLLERQWLTGPEALEYATSPCTRCGTGALPVCCPTRTKSSRTGCCTCAPTSPE